MNCGKCGGITQVLESRNNDQNIVRRRRKCVKCGERFTTMEMRVDLLLNKAQLPNAVAKSVPRPNLSPEQKAEIIKRKMEARRKVEARRDAKLLQDLYGDDDFDGFDPAPDHLSSVEDIANL